MDILQFQDAVPDGQPVVLPTPDEGPLIVARRVSFPAGTVVPMHRHVRGQFLFAISGVMFVRSLRQAWLVPPSRALWIPGAAQHAIEMHGDVRMRTLYLHEDCAKPLPLECAVFEVTALLRELILRMTSPLVLEDDRALGPLAQLAALEIGRLTRCKLELPMPRSDDLLRICERILLNPNKGERVASALGSARTRYRRFRAETGISFVQWRRQASLLVAVRRLAAGEAVTPVALDLGYESPSAFSTMFKRALGVSPRSFSPHPQIHDDA